jgi:hypothetical protein
MAGQRQVLQTEPSDFAWLISVPKRADFSEPLFHFGERVKVTQGSGRDRTWDTGRILGMKFNEPDQWLYTLQLDSDSPLVECGVQEVVAKQSELLLVQDSCCLRQKLNQQPNWLDTVIAASTLGISAIQLRKLRLKGLFKSGYHYRDISIPGSGLPRWQWHVSRCASALQIPPEKRPICR